MNNPVITTHQLYRRFGSTVAVNDLSLSIERGEVFGLLGHNGAGKTTTIRLMNGVLTPTGGTVSILGMSPETDGVAVRRKTGVLTETPSLYEQLTARANLTIFANLYDVPVNEVAHRVDAALDMLELSDRADEKAGGYSKGMKQRLALARTLLHQPEILFYDEPTAALDPVATRSIHNLVTHLSRDEGRTVILCTHNLVEAQKLCHRVAVMQQGRLLALGTPVELSHQMTVALRLDIEIAPEQHAAALAVLRAQAGLTVTECAENGACILTVSGAHRDRIPEMIAALVSARVPIYRVQPFEPSLEDVYFALTGQEVAQ